MRRIRAGMILGIGLAVASCGGGSSTEPDDSLTAEESLALLEVAMGHGLALTDDVTPGSDTVTPDGAVLQYTRSCAMGGTVAVDARAGFIGEPGGDSAGVELSATLVHSGCMETHQGSGITFTLDGAPELEMHIELTIGTEFMITLSGTVDGMVRWATADGRRGTCALDVALEPVDDPDALLGVTLTGQACGAQIMESFSATGLLS